MTEKWDRETFLADRREMLLALDVQKMRAYLRKYGEAEPTSDEVCMVAMHKARTAAMDLPLAERIKSRWWLREHGSKPMP